MPNRPALALLLMAFVAPVEARAEASLTLGLEGGVEYDDNVLFRSDDVQADGLIRLGPKLELQDEQGVLQYRARYFPSYEKFFDLSELDGWNQDAFASVSWIPSGRTRFTVRDHYLETNRATRIFDAIDPIDPGGDVGLLATQGFTQNIAAAELERKLTRIDLLTLSVQNTLSENEPLAELAVTEGDVSSASISWLHTFSARNQAGLFARYTRQQFENVTERVETQSDFYNASLQWIHAFDPTWTLSLSVGPAWVSSDGGEEQPTRFEGQPLYPVVVDDGARGPVLIETCPTLDDGTPIVSADCTVIPEQAIVPRGGLLGGSEFVFRQDLAETTDLDLIGELPEASTGGLTYFAALALTKQWRTVTASLRYSRDATTTASAAGNLRDVVQGNLSWRPTERLRLGLVASWEQRESETTGLRFDRALAPATAVAFDSQTGTLGLVSIGRSTGFRAVEVDRQLQNKRYTIALNLQYVLTRRASLFGRLAWIEQRVDDVFSQRDVTRFTATVGVRFYFDPINLPI